MATLWDKPVPADLGSPADPPPEVEGQTPTQRRESYAQYLARQRMQYVAHQKRVQAVLAQYSDETLAKHVPGCLEAIPEKIRHYYDGCDPRGAMLGPELARYLQARNAPVDKHPNPDVCETGEDEQRPEFSVYGC